MIYFVAFVFFAGLAWLAWKAIFEMHSVKLVVSEIGLISHKGLSSRTERELESFFAKDVELNSKVTIIGHLDKHKRLRFSFHGDLDQGTEQQIRNILHTLSLPSS